MPIMINAAASDIKIELTRFINGKDNTIAEMLLLLYFDFARSIFKCVVGHVLVSY
ncbi:hypothetical protein WSM22_07190 [Cytophagales bacterium WSM2-2]|nr:hypothetical protein WSM22_07190 [Cytophagales bacterium WSM2-2]